jgi:PAS domain S-box-containing protein
MKRLLTPPRFDDEDKDLEARLLSAVMGALAVTAVVILTLHVTFKFYLPVIIGMSAGLVILAAAFALMRAGHLQTASVLTLFTMTGVVAYLLVAGGGVHDVAVLAFPVIIVTASLLLPRRLFILMTLFGVALVAAIGAAELAGWLTPPASASTTLQDVLSVVVILALTAAAVRLLADNLLHSLARLRTELAERERMELQLRDAELRFRTLVEQIPAVTFILSPDNPAQTLYISPQIERVLGFTAAEWAADPGLWLRQLHPEDRGWAGAIADQMHTSGEPYTIDYRILDKDGRTHWLHSAARPIRDEAQRHVFSLGIDLDVTEQKQAEELLRRQAEQLATLNEVGRAIASLRSLEEVFDILYQQVQRWLPLDAFFITLYDSETDALTYPLVYDAGRRYAEPGGPLESTSSVAEVIRSCQPLCLNRTPEAVEAARNTPQYRVGDNQRPAASLLYVPLMIERRVLGVLSIQSYAFNAYREADVQLLTEVAQQAAIAIENARLYAEAQRLIHELEAKNAELERFTYTVSHDLKSPLITIRGFIGFVEQDAERGNLERLRADLARIGEATNKMQDLLEDLLELSRVGRIANPAEVIPLAAVAHEAAELVAGQLTSRGVQLSIAADLPQVLGDRVRLREVFQNLIDNAVKFMGDQAEPRIEIGVRRAGSEVVCFVRDNGRGIDPRYHDKVFNLFDKLDPQSEGTGVGLALVKRIIEVHGGRIWVESEGGGGGATFCFTLAEPHRSG